MLFYAAASGMLELVQKLLEQGADLNITDLVCHVNVIRLWHVYLIVPTVCVCVCVCV